MIDHKTIENAVNSLETPANSVNKQLRATTKIKRDGSTYIVLMGKMVVYRNSQRVFCREWLEENFPIG